MATYASWVVILLSSDRELVPLMTREIITLTTSGQSTVQGTKTVIFLFRCVEVVTACICLKLETVMERSFLWERDRLASYKYKSNLRSDLK